MKIGLAPMEGVLDPLMRKVITEASDVDFCSTEFVRVTDKLLPKHVFFKYAPELANGSKTESGTPVLLQILGGKPDWMAANAARALELGAYGVDINFGCPAKTVNRHDGGASLLKKPQRLFDVINRIRDEVGDKPHVSAKVRLGFSDKSEILNIAKACSDAGATWLTVHARTKEEGYKPPAHWHLIKKMKEACEIPVFANGDIWDLQAYQSCVSESGCEDVMIGRGLMRNPFLASEIKGRLSLTKEEVNFKILSLLLIYLEQSQYVYGTNAALGRVKQWLKMCTYPENKYLKDVFENIKTIKTTAEMKNRLKEIQNL